MDTPRELMETGYMVANTNADDLTGILLPLNLGMNSMRGTLTLMSEDANGEDFDCIADMVMRQPKATPAGAYRIRVQIYCAAEDELRVLPEEYGLDTVAYLAGFMDESDVRMEWEKSKTFEVETS